MATFIYVNPKIEEGNLKHLLDKESFKSNEFAQTAEEAFKWISDNWRPDQLSEPYLHSELKS